MADEKSNEAPDGVDERLLGEDERDDYGEEEDELSDDDTPVYEDEKTKETMAQFLTRHYKNLVHFLVEDWFLSAMLGIITAILSIFMDVAIEYLQHYRIILYEWSDQGHPYYGFVAWTMFMTLLVLSASLFCHSVSKQAVGSGIPEVKVIIHGFMLKNYLTLKTLIAKVVGLTLTLGAGMPAGKEGPFVHIGAIVATLLNKATSACQYNNFFSNEGRQMEMLSTGCAVGIACTFSAPAGAVLYGIESTSKYFAVKNYWRQFFATTCSALVFRFAMAAIVPTHIAGTILAYYQTNFPNEVFLVEEIPFFVLLGVFCGLFGALFVWLHRRVCMFKKRNRLYQSVFGKSPIAFTALMAALFAVVTYPAGFGRYIAGHLTFRETLADFIANCTFTLSNISDHGCPPEMIAHWTGGHGTDDFHPLMTLSCYVIVYFTLVALYVTLYYPCGIFVPSFVIGAGFGRICGELLAMWWPEGLRGVDGPHIYPGLYAVVGAAAYTGAVTHSLSIAVIVCETTGQLCALLPVLIALMVANALCAFLQPSIYESTIKIQGYPYLSDLPPSRTSVHTMKVDKVMVKDIVYITRDTTYKELRDILLETPSLRSYPFVNDKKSMILLGSVGRKYLVYLLNKKLGPEPSLNLHKRRSRTASEIFNTLGTFRSRNSAANLNNLGGQLFLTDRQISGNTLLAHSPLHDDQGERGTLAPFLRSQTEPVVEPVTSMLFIHETPFDHVQHSMARRAEVLASKIDLDDVAIDSAPFQLVRGTSLYKVHTLFSLLALNHAYVTERGRLVGVVALKELREAFNHIYSRGAVAIQPRMRTTSQFLLDPPELGGNERNGSESSAGPVMITVPRVQQTTTTNLSV